MCATPSEETEVLASEAALQQQLVVPGQLPPPSERPDGMEEPQVTHGGHTAHRMFLRPAGNFFTLGWSRMGV